MTCPKCGSDTGIYSGPTPWKLKAWTCTEGGHFAWQMACMADLHIPKLFARKVGYRVVRNLAIAEGRYPHANVGGTNRTKRITGNVAAKRVRKSKSAT